jgi:hypothetical protein
MEGDEAPISRHPAAHRSRRMSTERGTTKPRQLPKRHRPGTKWLVRVTDPNKEISQLQHPGTFDEVYVDSWLGAERLDTRYWVVYLGDTIFRVEVGDHRNEREMKPRKASILFDPGRHCIGGG